MCFIGFVHLENRIQVPCYNQSVSGFVLVFAPFFPVGVFFFFFFFCCKLLYGNVWKNLVQDSKTAIS